jgi:hypothetical protein
MKLYCKGVNYYSCTTTSVYIYNTDVLTTYRLFKKGEVHRITCHEGMRQGEIPLTFLEPWHGIGVDVPAILPLGRDPIPIVEKAGWAALGPVWTGT